MLSSPDAIRALYAERAHGLPPGRTVTLRPLVGPRSLLLLEGVDHLSRRKAMLPPFHGDRMRAYEAVVREAAAARARRAGRWASRSRCTRDAGDHARGDPARRLRRVRARTRCMTCCATCSSATISTQLQVSVLFGRRKPLERLQREAAEIDARLLAEIAARRAQPGEDICSLLVQVRFEDGSAMSDREVRDQLMTLLLAGHETTATGLAWTLDLLTRHPDEMDRMRVDGEPYVRAVVAESLRLRPVVPLAGRRLAVDLECERPARCPAGTDVTPAIWLAHTRPDAYPDPYAFRPRALPRAPAVDLHLDPVRRRRAPLPRRGVRGDGDAGRARRRSCAASTCAPARGAPSAWPAATSRSRPAAAHACIATPRADNAQPLVQEFLSALRTIRNCCCRSGHGCRRRRSRRACSPRDRLGRQLSRRRAAGRAARPRRLRRRRSTASPGPGTRAGVRRIPAPRRTRRRRRSSARARAARSAAQGRHADRQPAAAAAATAAGTSPRCSSRSRRAASRTGGVDGGFGAAHRRAPSAAPRPSPASPPTAIAGPATLAALSRAHRSAPRRLRRPIDAAARRPLRPARRLASTPASTSPPPPAPRSPPPASGRVVFAGYDDGWGLTVTLDHGNGLRTRYAHLSAIARRARRLGRAPARLVGRVGATGSATGPHLHFEVTVRGANADPGPALGLY